MPGKNNYHYAEMLNDSEETACGENVGYLITSGHDVTGDKDKVLEDRDGCQRCRDALVLGDA